MHLDLVTEIRDLLGIPIVPFENIYIIFAAQRVKELDNMAYLDKYTLRCGRNSATDPN
jgi:hypothetical protein